MRLVAYAVALSVVRVDHDAKVDGIVDSSAEPAKKMSRTSRSSEEAMASSRSSEEAAQDPHGLGVLYEGPVPQAFQGGSYSMGAKLSLQPTGGLGIEVRVPTSNVRAPAIMHDGARYVEGSAWTTEKASEHRAEWSHKYQCSADDRHKVLTVFGPKTREQVYMRTSKMCGAGLFTSPALTCDAVPGAALKDLTALADDVPQRAFGVELELVGRKPSEDQVFRNTSVGGAIGYQLASWQYSLVRSVLNSNWLERRVRQQQVGDVNKKKDPEEYQAGQERADGVLRMIRGLVKGDFADRYEQQMQGLPSLKHCAAQQVSTPAASSCGTHADCPLDHFCMSCDQCQEHHGRGQDGFRGTIAEARQQVGRHLGMFGGWVAEHLHGSDDVGAAIKDSFIACPQCRRAGQQVCLPRAECSAESAVGHFCPADLSKWMWTADVSVQLLSEAEVRQVVDTEEAVESETQGVGFELISPAPPHVLAGQSGVYGVAEQVGLLRTMGVQAGPTQGMHVHVNVGKPGKASTNTKHMGSDLTPRQIANVWVAYAKYQFVIDEMLQGSRVSNHYAHGLYFGLFRAPRVELREDGEVVDVEDDWETQAQAAESSQRTQSIFGALWSWVNWPEPGNLDDEFFCDSVLTGKVTGEEPDTQPCSERYPNQRYSQVNLAALNRLGTMEFRAFPATTDGERIVAWVKFMLKFVEHFKDAAHPFFDAHFEDGESEAEQSDWAKLRKRSMELLANAQVAASRSELEFELSLDLSDLFSKRWEQGNPACAPRVWTPEQIQGEALGEETARKFIAEQIKGGLPDLEMIDTGLEQTS